MTVEGEWRQAEMSGSGGISCEDERMCCLPAQTTDKYPSNSSTDVLHTKKRLNAL